MQTSTTAPLQASEETSHRANRAATVDAVARPTRTIGQAVLKRLAERGYQGTALPRDPLSLPAGCTALISCIASRTGLAEDAWRVDHQAQSKLLSLAKQLGVDQFVLLSAICVQKPHLPFQKAKLAFEAELQASGLRYCIVRPTAFFKSLAGQLKRVLAGKPFLVFGDGQLTRCKPISDEDLADYLIDCLSHADRANQILPIGGPGPALSPLDQVHLLEGLLGHRVRIKSVPVGLLKSIAGLLSVAGWFSKAARDKAELARIGLYYATESMLVWDESAGAYSESLTPETGQQRLTDFYASVIRGETRVDLGAHAVFKD
ncbi:MAG: NAD(P)H-binding protein [Burkholderiaceae bacterium]